MQSAKLFLNKESFLWSSFQRFDKPFVCRRFCYCVFDVKSFLCEYLLNTPTFLCSIEVTSKIWTSIPLAKKFVRWTCSKSSLFARFFDDQKIYFFLTKPAVSIYYFLIMLLLEISGVYVWMLFSQFFPPDWESWNTVQAKLNSQIFAKQMNWSSVTFIYPARAL